MGDLISREALLKEFGIDKDTPNVAKILMAVRLVDIEKKINSQPTAYDVDKVIEQLDEAYENNMLGDYHRIVKGGGQE